MNKRFGVGFNCLGHYHHQHQQHQQHHHHHHHHHHQITTTRKGRTNLSVLFPSLIITTAYSTTTVIVCEKCYSQSPLSLSLPFSHPLLSLILFYPPFFFVPSLHTEKSLALGKYAFPTYVQSILVNEKVFIITSHTLHSRWLPNVSTRVP